MIHDFGMVWSERALLLSGLANTRSVGAAAIAFAGAWYAADAGADVAAAGRLWFWPGHSLTVCAACRSCCLPTSCIMAFRRWVSGSTTGARASLALTSTTPPIWPRSCAAPGAAQPREPIEAGYRFRLPRVPAVPPHHPAAAAALRRPRDRQPDHPDHQGQRLPHHHRVAGVDACGEFDPVAALCSVRGLHHRGLAVLGALPRRRGRREFDRAAWPKRGA